MTPFKENSVSLISVLRLAVLIRFTEPLFTRFKHSNTLSLKNLNDLDLNTDKRNKEQNLSLKFDEKSNSWSLSE